MTFLKIKKNVTKEEVKEYLKEKNTLDVSEVAITKSKQKQKMR